MSGQHTQGAAQSKGKEEATKVGVPPSDLVTVRVTKEIYALKKMLGGRKTKQAIAWNHLVSHDGKEFKPGDTLKLSKDKAQRLIDSGDVQLASQELVPFTPFNLTGDKILSFGISKAADIRGKIPSRTIDGSYLEETTDEDDY